MESRVLIIIGTYGQAFIDSFDGKILAIDTAETVSHLLSSNVQPIHLIPNETEINNSEIPKKLINYGSPDGSALIETYSYWILETNNWLKEIIERFVCDASEVFVISSSGGGTGNGTYEKTIKILRELKISGRLIFIHPIHSAINPKKQLSRIKSLRKTGTSKNETHILVKDQNTICEVLSLRGKEIDAVNEIVVNLSSKKMPGEENLTLLMMRKKYIDESQFKKNIERDIINSLFSRFAEGRGRVSSQILQRAKTHVFNEFREISYLLNRNISFDEMVKFYHGSCIEFQKTAELLVDKYAAECFNHIDKKIETALPTIFDIGYENVKPEIRELCDQLDRKKGEIESELSTSSLSQVFHKTRKEGLIPWWLKNIFGMNGVLPEELRDYLLNETRLKIYSKTNNTIKNKLLKWEEVNKPISNITLPANAKIKEDLQDIYLKSPDHSTGLNNLRTKIDERFSEIILEVIKESHIQDFSFDYEVSSNIYQSTGMIIPSNYKRELEFLVDFFHLNRAYIKYLSQNSGAISITLFALVNNFSKIPELYNMIQRVDNKNEDDRRYYARTVKEIFAPTYREKTGVSEESAAQLLVQSFLTTGVLTTFNRRFDRIVINIKGNRKSFLDFSSFAERLTVDNEDCIHDQFWTQFARNRSKTILDLEKVKDEKVTDTELKRISTVKKFIGSKRWSAAIEEILRQVKIADSYY